MLRKTASALLQSVYRVSQRLGRHAVDGHVERHLVDDFVKGDYGAAYGIGHAARAKLVGRMRAVAAQVPSATRLLYHVVLARELFSLPPSMQGDVIECGAYKGASSASLSLACEMVQRRLWICDSFSGLPAAEADVVRDYPHQRLYGRYAPGMYSGSLDEVRRHVERYGAIGQCEFVRGLFADTLPKLTAGFVFAFLDVDLTSSLRDCVRYIWPRLADGGVIYTDDSCDMEVVRVWFDDSWWQRELGRAAPGYVGTGCGLPLALAGSSLGYSRKIANVRQSYDQAQWLAAG